MAGIGDTKANKMLDALDTIDGGGFNLALFTVAPNYQTGVGGT